MGVGGFGQTRQTFPGVIGEGVAGPITRRLQRAFFDIIDGKTEDKYGWLTHVPKYNEVPA